MRSTRITWVAILALILSLLVPGQIAANATSTVTKTIYVTKSDGTSPYVGAQVALVGSDVLQDRNMISAVSTVGAEGYATVVVDQSIDYWAVAVQPPVGDFTHASTVFSADPVDEVDQSFHLTLKEANTRVRIALPDGSNAPAASSIQYPSSNPEGGWAVTIRPGDFAIDIASDISPGEVYSLAVDAAANNAFFHSYGLTVDAQGGRHAYTDEKCLSELVAVNGVLVLKTDPPNLAGSLVQTGGTSYNLPTGVRAYVSFIGTNEDGTLNPDTQSSYFPVASNGNFGGLVTAKPGHYFAQVMFSGADNRPGFKASAFWVNSEGKFSDSAAGTFVDQADYRVRLAVPTTAPNFIFHSVTPGTTSLDPSYIYMYDSTTGSSLGPGFVPSGIASFILDDGQYRFDVQPLDASRQTKTYDLRIQNGNPTLTQLPGTAVAPVNGIFVVTGSNPNLKIRAIDPDTNKPVSNGWGYIYQDLGNEFGNDYSAGTVNGVMNFELPNGSNYKAQICPNDRESKFSCQTYDLVKTSGDATVTLGAYTSSTVDGFLNIALKKNNLRVKITAPNTLDTAQRGAYLEVQKANSNGTKTLVQSANSWQGFGGAYLDDGDFVLTVHPGDLTSSAGEQKYKVKVVNGAATVTTMADLAVPISGGIYTTTLSVPNFKAKLVHPTDPSVSIRGADISLMKQTASGWDWVNDYWTSTSEIGINLEDGTYRLTVNPNYKSLGLSEKTYKVVVAGATITVEDMLTNPVQPNNGVYPLTGSLPNLSGRLVDSAGNRLINTGDTWVNVMVEQLYGGVKWSSSATAARFDSSTGTFSARITEAGTYRLRIRPYGYSNVAATVTPSFTVNTDELASFSKNFGDLKLDKPLLKIQVRTATGSTNIVGAGYQIMKNGQYLDWLNIGSNGTGVVSVDGPGTYQIQLDPGELAGTSTAKTYVMTVVQSSDGTLSASVDGVAPDSNGITVLKLGVPTLSGKLFSADGISASRYAQIIPVDQVTGRERWDLVTSTDQQGRWALRLPQGSYTIYARGGNAKGSAGVSDPSTVVTVDSSGVATLVGSETRTANTFDLQLSPPTWGGVTLDPSGATPVANVQVCLVADAIHTAWNCSYSDSNGAWTLTKPFGFTAFDAQSELIVTETGVRQYAERRIKGSAAVSSVLGDYSQNITNKNAQLRLQAPNFEVTVTAAGRPTPNVWLNLTNDDKNFSANGTTNASGVARFYVSDPESARNIQAYIGSLQGFANTTKKYSSFTLGQDGIAHVTIPLAVPNLNVVITEPDSPDKKIPGVWIESYNQTQHVWAGSPTSDSNGLLSLYLAPPESGADVYRLTVHSPNYQTSTGMVLNDNIYNAVVNSTGEIVVTKGETAIEVPPTTVAGKSGNFYPFTLLKPSLTGKVTQPDLSTPVPWTWVSISGNNANYWTNTNGAGTRYDGTFGVPLKDGDYQLVANAPWDAGLNGIGKSATCAVTVTGGQVNSPQAPCVDSNNNVKLSLRNANVSFVLKNPTTGAVVPDAWVYLSIGNWNATGHSDSNGRVWLLIDPQEILASNDSHKNNQIWSWLSVQAPYGQSSVISFNCSTSDTKSVCSPFANLLNFDTTTASTFVPSNPWNLGDINFQTPNTRLRVTLPDGTSVGAGSWVMISKPLPGCPDCLNYVAGANTDSSGQAAFNLDQADIDAGNLSVEVNPSWDYRLNFTPRRYSGLSYDQLNNHSFAFATPNLRFNLYQAVAGSSLSRWSWIEVQKQDPQNPGSFRWVPGANTDDSGQVRLTLESSSRFKLIIHPGPSSLGTTTTCFVGVDSQGIASIDVTDCDASPAQNVLGTSSSATSVNLKLARGNVQGVVTFNGGGFEGAVVIAEAIDPLTHTPGILPVKIVTTDQSGAYGLQLDENVTWRLSVISVIPDKSGTKVDADFIPLSGRVEQRNIEIVTP